MGYANEDFNLLCEFRPMSIDISSWWHRYRLILDNIFSITCVTRCKIALIMNRQIKARSDMTRHGKTAAFFAVVYHAICEHAFRREFSSLVILSANIVEWKIRICQTSWKAHISVLIIIQYLYHFKRFVPFEYLEMFHFNQISKSRWYKQEIKSSMKSLHKNNVCHQLHEARVMMLGYRKRESFYVHLHRNTVQVKIHYSSGRDSGKIPCLNYTLIIW